MIRVDRKVYEEIILHIIRTSDIEKLEEEFLQNPRLFGPILQDISSGKKSLNYHILKKISGNNDIVERFIIERATCILSESEYREPQDEYWKILSELRRHWLNLLNIYYPYKAGDQWLSITKKIDEVYEALRGPIERDENETGATPIVVDHHWWKRFALYRSAYLFLSVLIIGIFTLFFYTKESSMLFSGISEKTAFSKAVDNNSQHSPESTILEDVNRPYATESRSGGKGTASSSPNENKSLAVYADGNENVSESNGTLKEIKTKTIAKANDIENEETELENSVQEPKQSEKITLSQTQQEQDDASPAEQEEEEERPPVRVEELLTAQGKWIFDFNILYSNIDTSSDRAQVITIDGPMGQPILIPVFLGEQVTDEDFISYIMDLRYGVTKNLEIFTYTGFFSDFQRLSLNDENESDSDSNFNFAGIGATYQIRPEDKYPAILASASANIADNTNFGNDDYEINFFKTFTGTLVSYYTVDPIVFFFQAVYQQNLKRRNEISINPGEFFSLSPQIFFVVNPYINLTWGARWRIQGHTEINGEVANSTRTGISPLFGVTYGVTNNLILSLDTEYRNEGSISQAIANLGFTYMF